MSVFTLLTGAAVMAGVGLVFGVLIVVASRTVRAWEDARARGPQRAPS